MAQTAVVSHFPASTKATQPENPADVVPRDPGPWLALLGPVCIGLTLAITIYLSMISF